MHTKQNPHQGCGEQCHAHDQQYRCDCRGSIAAQFAASMDHREGKAGRTHGAKRPRGSWKQRFEATNAFCQIVFQGQRGGAVESFKTACSSLELAEPSSEKKKKFDVPKGICCMSCDAWARQPHLADTALRSTMSSRRTLLPTVPRVTLITVSAAGYCQDQGVWAAREGARAQGSNG